jgi:hypothetical protein
VVWTRGPCIIGNSCLGGELKMWDGIQGQTFKQLLHPACGVVQRFDVIRYYCKLWVVFCFIHFEPMRSMVFLCNPFSKSDVLVQTITIDSFVGDWCSTVQHSLILTTRQLAECQLAIVGEVPYSLPPHYSLATVPTQLIWANRRTNRRTKIPTHRSRWPNLRLSFAPGN